mmetsp:Transcript_79617/g.251636  ORF Transcript_79617/g.251636 Transcript_79617/m.251636 type:complete len:222 (-) Transcript_79617:8-673(-)
MSSNLCLSFRASASDDSPRRRARCASTSLPLAASEESSEDAAWSCAVSAAFSATRRAAWAWATLPSRSRLSDSTSATCESHSKTAECSCSCTECSVSVIQASAQACSPWRSAPDLTRRRSQGTAAVSMARQSTFRQSACRMASMMPFANLSTFARFSGGAETAFELHELLTPLTPRTPRAACELRRPPRLRWRASMGACPPLGRKDRAGGERSARRPPGNT